MVINKFSTINIIIPNVRNSSVYKSFSWLPEIQFNNDVIDVLIGFEYAGYHPMKKECNDHLLLLENRFGKCLGGSHPLLLETTRKLVKHAVLHHAKISEIDQFFTLKVWVCNVLQDVEDVAVVAVH